MLRKLQIQNYAIIEALAIDLSGHLNAITGETGAGKSILMGALSLLLGDRADSSVLLDRDKKCIVEGVFSADGKRDVMDFFRANDLGDEPAGASGQGQEIIIRREIAPSGKSRAFVNDTPVLLEQLRKLSSLLVDLHRQFDTLELGESDFQRGVLDALAGQGPLVDEYRLSWRAWITAGKELAALQEEKTRFTRELDYNKFLFDELEEQGYRGNELEELDQELKLLNNSEEIKTSVARLVDELGEGETPIVQRLRSFVQQLNHYAAYHGDLDALSKRMQSVQIELQDITGDLERIKDHVQHDPRRIEEINERLSAGYKLLKKHGVNTTADLLAIKAGLEKKLQAVLNLDELIVACERRTADLLETASRQALTLSRNRKAQVGPLEERVNGLLRQVGMPNAQIRVEVGEVRDADAGKTSASGATGGALGPYGMDRIEFLFDANKSQRFESIRKVASGGELSRLMLCISSLVAQSMDLPTLIFDEIDSGISGEAARQVGVILKELAQSRQVICITHQPQIAGKADAHYFVYKEVRGERVKTGIRLLGREERITAIAQMLGGEKPTAAALENAREMVMR